MCTVNETERNPQLLPGKCKLSTINKNIYKVVIL